MSVPGDVSDAERRDSEPVSGEGHTDSGTPNIGNVRRNGALYKVSFDESVRTLDQQREELSAIRQRGVQYLALVVTATAFLVGSTLTGSREFGNRDGVFYAVAGLGTALMATTIVLAGVLLWPGYTKMSTRASAKLIQERFIDPEVPASSEGYLYRTLALYNDKSKRSNELVLAKVRAIYLAVVVLGALQVAAWVVLVWLRA